METSKKGYMRFELSFVKVLNIIALISWLIVAVSYFLQFPFKHLSQLIVPTLAIYLIAILLAHRRIEYSKTWLRFFYHYMIYLLLMVIFGFFNGAEFQNIIRFFLILIVIPLFTVIKNPNFKNEYNLLLFFAVIKSLILIFIAFQLFKTGTHQEFRQLARMNGYGDIYIDYFTNLPKVQVHGNALLPFLFMVNYEYRSGKLNLLIDGIILLGVLAAGNSAFILCLAAYAAYKFLKYIYSTKSNVKRFFSFSLLAIGGVLFLGYSLNVLSQKAVYSNLVRFDQAKALMDNYIIIGMGLGNPINYTTAFRRYSGDVYFELQTLYIINQIGFIGLSLFYLLTCLPLSKLGKREFILFLIYLLYTFWNPYCFDTTEMIALSVLINHSTFENLKVLPT